MSRQMALAADAHAVATFGTDIKQSKISEIPSWRITADSFDMGLACTLYIANINYEMEIEYN